MKNGIRTCSSNKRALSTWRSCLRRATLHNSKLQTKVDNGSDKSFEKTYTSRNNAEGIGGELVSRAHFPIK